MYGKYGMVWYGKQKGQKPGFKQSRAGCLVPLKTLERLRGWEDERIEGIEGIEGIEESENPMIFEELKEFYDFEDMVRSSELWRKQRVTPLFSHATIVKDRRIII